jgi:hypothetical protein
MGQIYSNNTGSVKAYWTPPVPGGIVGQSAALAVAQGARTPGEIASQGGWNLFASIMVVIVLIVIINIFAYIVKPKTEGFTIKQGPYPMSEHDERCAPFPTLR